MRRVLIRKSKGFTIVETIVALGLILISVGASYGTITTAYSLKNKKQATDIIENIRASIVGTINSSGGWRSTIQSNPGVMACLQTTATSGCGAVAYSLPQQFLVEYATGNLAGMGYTANSLGFDREGEVCNYLTNPQCAYRFRVFWNAICDNPACQFPLFNIRGTLDVKPAFAQIVPNPGRFSFEFVRGASENNAKDQCDLLNGTFNPATSVCTLQGNGVVCPDGQVVVGVSNSQGLIQCQPMFVSFTCPADHYIKGVNVNGTPICAPLAVACLPNFPNGYSDGAPSGDGDGGGGDCGGDSGDCDGF